MDFPTEVPNNETVPVQYIMETDETEEVQYVYNDDDIGIPDADDYQNITHVILEDGTRAMIVNGTLVTADGQALVIQDEADLNQYSVKDENESQNQFSQILVPQDIQNTAQNVVRYVQEETAVRSKPNDQIFYIQQENNILQPIQEHYEIAENTAVKSKSNNQIFYIQQENILQPMQEQYQTAENPNQLGQLIQLADDQIIVDENGDVVDLDELLSKEQQNGNYQYTVAADGTFCLSNVTAAKKTPDISEIKGKNIATGEVITISQYLKKIKKELSFADAYASKNGINANKFDAQRSKSSIKELKKLINKKIPIRQTETGKNLVAKITKIIKKPPSNSPINKQKRLSTNAKQLNRVVKKSQPTRLTTEPAVVETNPTPTEPVIVEIDLTQVETDPTPTGPVIMEIDLTQVETDPTLIETEPVTVVSESAAFETTSTTAEIDLAPNETDETQLAVPEPEPQPNSTVIIHKKKIRQEAFDVISKTLSGLMNMDSVVRKLENKTLIVTMMEKVFNLETERYSKNVSYCIGFMIREYELDSADGKVLENWKFLLDGNSSEIILGQSHAGSISQENPSRKEKSYANLTIEITQNEAGDKNTKVIINPPAMFQCKTCGISYRTSSLLKLHSLEQHRDPSPDSGPGLECKKCVIKFKTFSEAEEHTKLRHLKKNSLGMYECVDCQQRFKTPLQIEKHVESRFKCSFCNICNTRFHGMAALKKHTLSKHTEKPEIKEKENNKFRCNICNKQFARHSNLLRHTAIHKGDGANFQCAICYCSYQYVSSLTRHIVSNHVEKKPVLEVPPINLPEVPSEIITQIEEFDFLQNDQIVQMIPLENMSGDALEQFLQDVPAGPVIVDEETGPR